MNKRMLLGIGFAATFVTIVGLLLLQQGKHSPHRETTAKSGLDSKNSAFIPKDSAPSQRKTPVAGLKSAASSNQAATNTDSSRSPQRPGSSAKAGKAQNSPPTSPIPKGADPVRAED